MKKKILALCLVVVLAVTAVTGVTLAYFTDAEQATNVMTIGNVQINIEERTFDFNEETEAPFDGEWKNFENGSLTLYPVDHENNEAKAATNQLWNKSVRTFNTSPSEDAAYIRTIIAVEHIPYAGQWQTAVGLGFSNEVTDYNVMPQVVVLDDEGNERTYDVYVCTAADKLPIEYGKYFGSLQSVYLYADVTAEEAAQANNELDILVLSQGIQAAGFKTASNTVEQAHDAAMAALDEVNAANLSKWFFGAEGVEAVDTANVNEFPKFHELPTEAAAEEG